MWDALAVEVHSRVESGAFGLSFPLTCEDSPITYGCNASAFWKVADAHLPDWRQDEHEVPHTLGVLDFLEFCYERVAEPIQGRYHDYYRHYHLSFDRDRGRERFRRDVNTILARNALAYELKEPGEIKRIPTPVLAEAVLAVFSTSDGECLITYWRRRSKYLIPDPSQRKESLEKIWDAWERLKTLENPSNKKAPAFRPLNAANRPTVGRPVLEANIAL